MSIKWTSYVWEQTPYKNGDLLTALALADFANDEGECFPHLETVAKKARLTVRQVQKILKKFEAQGFLVFDRKSGRGNRSEFQLKKVNFATEKKVNFDAEKVNSVTQKGELCDIKKVNFATFPIYKDEPSIEPSEKGTRPNGNAQNLTPETPEPAPPKKTEEIPNGNASPYPLPKGREFNLAPGVVEKTAKILGFTPNLHLQTRMQEVVPKHLESEWFELVKNRMAVLRGSHKNTIESKIGYWFGDFQRENKFQLAEKPLKTSGMVWSI